MHPMGVVDLACHMQSLSGRTPRATASFVLACATLSSEYSVASLTDIGTG